MVDTLQSLPDGHKKHTDEALAKLSIFPLSHSERSEESNVPIRLRSFTSFRMTKTAILQETQILSSFSLAGRRPGEVIGALNGFGPAASNPKGGMRWRFPAPRLKDSELATKLGGQGKIVEADETCWGNTNKKKPGPRGFAHKEKIFSLVEQMIIKCSFLGVLSI